MACKSVQSTTIVNEIINTERTVSSEFENRLLFGVDSKVPSNDILQNNLTEFEWVTRNKIYPNFWGRNITGKDCLTKEEIKFLHTMGCKIAATYSDSKPKDTEEQGKICAKEVAHAAVGLGIPSNTAIFLEIGATENVSKDYMCGFARELISKGYTPGFKANTDAAFDFDRQYSRGMQSEGELFKKCLVWAVAPGLKEYERVTTTHFIHPDNWGPFAPSGITRNDIAVWQYGKECHPIMEDANNETFFNVNLVRNSQVIIEKMF